jgi:nucleotide-binding universal stress UspA family protein
MQASFVDSVFHPSDFSAGSENAFVHALALALIRRTEFTILHTSDSREDWRNFPAVRATLERWGMLQPGSPRSAVFEQLALRVTKVSMKSRSPLAAMLHYLESHPTDLIVLATEGRTGLPRWHRPSVAEHIAVRTRTKTLFVPGKSRGFVSREDGTLSLRRILVPVDQRPSPLPALEYSARIAGALPAPVEIILVHVGENMQIPIPALPEIGDSHWKQEYRRGELVTELIRAAREHQVDLIIMTTAGHEGILDRLHGSVTQQVLRAAPCPLLAIPE